MTARRRTIALAWVVLVGASGLLVMSHVRVEDDLSLLLPQARDRSQQLLLDQLRTGPTSRLILIGLEGAGEATLSEMNRKLAAWMRDSGDFVYVANGDRARTQGDLELLFRHRYLLSPAVTRSRFEPAQLRAALEERLHDLASPLSLVVNARVDADPTGELASILTTWQGEETARRYNGVWFTADGRRSLLLAETRAPGFDLSRQEQLQDRLKTAFDETVSTTEGAGHGALLLSGPAVFSVEAQRTIWRESMELSVIAVCSVGLVLYMAYRSIGLVALSAVPLLSAIVASVAAVGLIFGYIHGITLAFGMTLIGVAIDYPIHVLSHVDDGAPAATALKRVWPTMRLGVLTTLMGFSAMLVSGFPGLSQLGCFAVVGLLVAAYVTRWVLPALIPSDFKPVTSLTGLDPWMSRMRTFRWVPLTGMLVATVYLLWPGASLWEHDLAGLSPVSSEKKALDRDLRRELGAPDVRELIVVDGETEQVALQSSELLRPDLDRLVGEGALGGYDMAARHLPSVKTQRERQAALPDSLVLRRDLGGALSGLPFNRRAFEPFLAAVAGAKRQAPLTSEDFSGTGLGLTLKSLLVERDGQWAALVLLHDVRDRDRVMRMLRERDDTHVTYVDMKGESNRLVTAYRDEALSLVGWGGLAIVVVLLLGLRSLLSTVRVVAPVVGSVIVVLAVLHGLGEKFSLFHLSTMLLVVGIGLDYALFFDRTALSSEEREQTIVSVLLCGVTTALVFGILAFSEIPVLRAIGMTAAFGAVACLVFSACLSREPAAPSGVV